MSIPLNLVTIPNSLICVVILLLTPVISTDGQIIYLTEDFHCSCCLCTETAHGGMVENLDR